MKLIPKIHFVNCPVTKLLKDYGDELEDDIYIFYLMESKEERKKYKGLCVDDGSIYIRNKMGFIETVHTIIHELFHFIIYLFNPRLQFLHHYVDQLC